MRLPNMSRLNLLDHRVLFSLMLITACVFIWSGCIALAGPRSAAAASPVPTPSPPVIDFLAVPNHDVVEREKEVVVFLLISNKSDQSVQLLDVALAGPSFTGGTAINAELKPFASRQDNLTITANNDAEFIQNRLLLTLRYSWKIDGQPVTSTQAATIPLLVQRHFEEEAKGLPGGTAAFLYLLLPVIPALLSYQLVERWRKGEGLRLPTFGAEQIVPAFFLAVVLSFVILWIAKNKAGLDYANPLIFAEVLAISLAAGAIIPTFKLFRDWLQFKTWGFSDNESAPSYLRKALLSPWSPAEFSWATGNVRKVTWQGILLEQPGGAKVLGAVVQISRSDKVDEQFWVNAQRELFDGDMIRDRKRLVEMVEADELTVKVLDPVLEGSRSVKAYVAVGQVKGFQQTNIEVRNLLRPLT